MIDYTIFAITFVFVVTRTIADSNDSLISDSPSMIKTLQTVEDTARYALNEGLVVIIVASFEGVNHCLLVIVYCICIQFFNFLFHGVTQISRKYSDGEPTNLLKFNRL